jgi:hypothetical protein
MTLEEYKQYCGCVKVLVKSLGLNTVSQSVSKAEAWVFIIWLPPGFELGVFRMEAEYLNH